MNLWVLDSTIFSAIEKSFHVFFEDQEKLENSELYLPDVIQGMIDYKKVAVNVYNSTSQWFGLTYQKDKSSIKSHLDRQSIQGQYPSPLWTKN
jgi:hypothetical protein